MLGEVLLGNKVRGVQSVVFLGPYHADYSTWKDLY